MNKTEVIALLKTIMYPGFNRDIVSFGMIHNIEIKGDDISVILKIQSAQEDKKLAVVELVKKRLEETKDFKNITMDLVSDPQAGKHTAESGASKPNIDGKIKYIIAVASGKGGVGKSTVAANIAAVLKERGHSVGLLDLDIYGPSLPILLGFNERPTITPEKKLIPLERFGIKVMSFGFISGNDAPVIWRGPLVAKMTEQFFGDVEWGELDYLILDLPPGTGDVQLTLTQKMKLSGAIIVTTPQDIALADVRKGADMFSKVQTPVLGVVENMSGLFINGRILSQGEMPSDLSVQINNSNQVKIDGDGRFTLLMNIFKQGGGEKESKRLGVPLLGSIPIAQEIVDTTDNGIPLVIQDPESAISEEYRNIVNNLEKNMPGE
ncbi:P-loop NTPase [Candidatus Neomarinimicrobiota bacterium]